MRTLSRLFMGASLTACLVDAVGAASACQTVQAGAVLNYIGRASDYELRRAGSVVPVRAFLEIRAQDSLRVLEAGGRLTVQRSDTTTTTVRQSDGQVCFTSGSPPSFVRNLWSGFAAWFAVDRSNDGQLLTRESELVLWPPDLAGGKAEVSAGIRPLAIGWRGGVGDYSVRVEGPGGTVVDERRISALALRLRQPRRLAPGVYKVTLSDASGKTVTGSFRAVADKLSTTPVTDDEAMTLAGERLALGANRRFDAFMLLERERERSGAAASLIEAIASAPGS